MIDALAGGTIRHRSTTHENVEKKVREKIRSGHPDSRTETPEDIPRSVIEALTLDAQARHYREWLDDKIPALDNHTPREAAANKALRPKLFDLIRGLEGMYQQALKNGAPAYDPSWMWGELGLEDRLKPAYPPPLAHERMASMVPDLGKLCRRVAAHLRQQPGFDDASACLTTAEIRTNLEVQRFLREHLAQKDLTDEQPASDIVDLTSHLEYMINFELHRRKTFWVDESLAYMLSKTDLDAPGSDLRSPFLCFALVFTDRHFLSLAERLLSADPNCPVSGHFLRVATIYIMEEQQYQNRSLRIWFVFDALGADPPHVIEHRIALEDDTPIRLLDEDPEIQIQGIDIRETNPLHGLLHVTINAILYATSAGVEPQRIEPPSADDKIRAKSKRETFVFSGDDVFFLPGAIEISNLRNFQQLERISGGRTILHRFMVRGHWRRAARGWKDQRMRWIAPYWKGPDIAAVIERTYKLKP